MGRTMWLESDREYIRRDGGNDMQGPLSLSGTPTEANHAARKQYIDDLIGALSTLTPTEIAALIAVLTVPGGTIDARITAALAAALVAYLPIDGSVAMTGLLTLSGAPVDNLHAATKLYVDSIPPPSLDTYDAVVDAAGGGDYTTLVAACAGEAANARIFVKRGTYNEVADVVMKDAQMLIGENPDDTVINFGGANRQIVFAGAGSNLCVKDLTIRNSTNSMMVDLQGDYARVDNCRLYGGAGLEGVSLIGDEGVVSNTLFSGFATAGMYAARLQQDGIVIGCSFQGCQRGVFANFGVQVIGCQFATIAQETMLLQGHNCVIGNQCYGTTPIVISGEESQIVGNYFRDSGISVDGAHEDIVISGNFFINSTINISLAGAIGWSVTGNSLSGSGGVVVNAPYTVVTGNSFKGTTSLDLQAGTYYCVVTGNNLAATTAAPRLQDAGAANLVKDNLGADVLLETDHTRMKNTSGAGVAVGDVVVLKAVAAGDEFTTTVNQGDDMVLGMCSDLTINNNAYGFLQQIGKTVSLKVNGTVAIAIGDLLGTFTAAGIAMKAAAGDMAFAIALEAYAVADSNGVIDALLITPRKV